MNRTNHGKEGEVGKKLAGISRNRRFGNKLVISPSHKEIVAIHRRSAVGFYLNGMLPASGLFTESHFAGLLAASVLIGNNGDSYLAKILLLRKSYAPPKMI